MCVYESPCRIEMLHGKWRESHSTFQTRFRENVALIYYILYVLFFTFAIAAAKGETLTYKMRYKSITRRVNRRVCFFAGWLVFDWAPGRIKTFANIIPQAILCGIHTIRFSLKTKYVHKPTWDGNSEVRRDTFNSSQTLLSHYADRVSLDFYSLFSYL